MEGGQGFEVGAVRHAQVRQLLRDAAYSQACGLAGAGVVDKIFAGFESE